MKTGLWTGRIILALLLLHGSAGAQSIAHSDIATIERITGLRGTLSTTEPVFKLTKPRDDVKVSVDGMPLPPFMGLSSWAAFSAHGGQLMMMGDTVLFEDEVNPAMSAALDAGLEVTALHNHFFFDQPRVYFMHIGGVGSAEELAGGVRRLQDTVVQIRRARPQPAGRFDGGTPRRNRISAEPLEQMLDTRGEAKDGMFKVTIGRNASMHGVTIGKEMGVNTWAGFAGTDDAAVVDGDFAVLADELQPVLRAMRGAGINIVAIHQHMTAEEPRMLFLHYWGKGPARDLAAGVKKALEAQASVRQQAAAAR